MCLYLHPRFKGNRLKICPTTPLKTILGWQSFEITFPATLLVSPRTNSRFGPLRKVSQVTLIQDNVQKELSMNLASLKLKSQLYNGGRKPKTVACVDGYPQEWENIISQMDSTSPVKYSARAFP